jgi:hypothetical protein
MKIPEGYDINEIKSWISEEDGDEILETFENDGNFNVFSKYENEFSFTRFFIMNGKTYTSVDFRGSLKELINKFGELMNDKFGL